MCYLLLVFVPVLLLVLPVLRPHVVRRQQLRVRVRFQERTQPFQRTVQRNLKVEQCTITIKIPKFF